MSESTNSTGYDRFRYAMSVSMYIDKCIVRKIFDVLVSLTATYSTVFYICVFIRLYAADRVSSSVYLRHQVVYL